MSLITDFRFALRSLARVKGLAITVVMTLAPLCHTTREYGASAPVPRS